MSPANRIHIPPGPLFQRWAWLFLLPGGLLAAFLTLPLLALVWNGLSDVFLTYLHAPNVQRAIWLSMLTSSMSVGLIVLLGTPLAYALVRWPFRGKSLLELLVDLPLVLPPLIAGIALLLVFGRAGLLGHPLDAFGIRLPFTTAAVVMAQVFVAGSLYLRAARIGFAAIDLALREAAYVEGADELQLVRYVMLPLAQRALVSGGILAWARAFGEFGATIVFAGNMEGRTQTMPLAIFVGFETNLEIALSVSLVLLLISLGVLLVLRRVGQETAVS